MQTEVMREPLAPPRNALDQGLLPEKTLPPVRWEIAPEQVAYEAAIKRMEQLADNIGADRDDERIWLLEHPALYTAGTSAKDSDLIEERFPVHVTGRGGEHTYHGPGPAYLLLYAEFEPPNQRYKALIVAT